MNLKEIASIRLQNQQITGTKFKTAKEIVGCMGAMQAQDYAMSKWAVGLRLPGLSDESLEKSLAKGEILRTHVLRPTWHLVSSDDIGWMLELTAPHVKSLMRSSNKKLELTAAVFGKSNSIIEKALASGRHLTREELIRQIEKAKIPVSDNRAAHLMFWAELDGIICSGAIRNKKQTYALLSERNPKAKKISREEALAKLAKKYFYSHCPATLKDFIWWSGLPVADAKKGLELIKKELLSETIGAETYWLPDSFSVPEKNENSVYLLPAFDEFIISYKDRAASVSLEHQKRSFTSNGIFRPLIIVNGQATGLWKRTVKNDKVIIETEFFHPHTKTIKAGIKQAAENFGTFLGLKVELKV